MEQKGTGLFAKKYSDRGTGAFRADISETGLVFLINEQ